MKTCHSAGYFKQLILFLLLSLMTVFVLSGNALAELACFDCHGNRATSDYRPQDFGATYRNITTGAFVGSHNTHMAANATVNSCDRCHVKNTTAGHRDGKISFLAKINGSPAATQYNKAGGLGFVNQTSNYNMTNATCSSVNCHFETTTREWGNPAAQAEMGCDSCHSTLSSAHTKHKQKYGTVGANYLDSCTTCHPNRTGFSHATSAGRDIALTVSSYSGSNFQYLPSQVSGRVFGSCSTTDCHSNGQSATGGLPPVYSPVSWGSTLSCNGCHDVTKATLTSGSHSKHLNAPGVSGCADCHVDVTGTEGAYVYTSSRHVDKFLNVTGGYTEKNELAGNGTFGKCSAAACHDNGTGTKVLTGTWGVSGPPCSACHDPRPATGSHNKHMNTAYSSLNCASCHNGAVEGGPANSDHLDTNIDVYKTTKGDLGYPADKQKGSPYQNCGTAYCHSNGQSASGGTPPVYRTVKWGDPLACNGCHDVSKTTLTSGSHSQHLNASGVTGCADCHVGVTGTDGAYVYNSTRHVDTFLNVTGGYNQKDQLAGNGNFGQCSATSCHNNGKGVKVQTPVWGDNAAACYACHQISPTTDSHGKHLTETLYKKADCGQCHTGAIEGSNAGANHRNGNVDVIGYSNPSSHPIGGAFQNCATTYCHSSGQSTTGGAPPVYAVTPPVWGATGSVTCGSCHATTTLATGSHSKHFNGIAPNNNCGNCHVDASTTAYNSVRHVDRFLNVTSGYTEKNELAGNGTYGKCTAAACHDNGKGIKVDTLNWGQSAGQCNACHAAAMTTDSHGKHLTGLAGKFNRNALCADCHAGNDVTTPTTAATHLNTTIEVTVGGYPSPRNKGTLPLGTCGTAYCHSNGKSSYQPVTWGQTNLNCKSCHPTLGGAHNRHIGGFTGAKDWANLPFYQYTANKSGGTDGTTLADYAFGCANCHPVDPASHMNNTVDVTLDNPGNVSTLRAKNQSPGFAPGTTVGTNTLKCQNVYCHSDGKGGQKTTIAWGDTFTGDRCAQCHDNSPTGVGAHGAHVVGIHADDIFSGTSGKLIPGTSNSVSHGLTAQATTLNCDVCHTLTVTNSRNRNNSACNSCHSADASTDPTPLLNIANHVVGKPVVSFKNVQFVSKAQLRPGSFVNYTGGDAGWKRHQVAGVDQYKTADENSYDFAKNPLSTTVVYTPGAVAGQGSCANVVCHNQKAGQTVQWNTTLTCNSCHSSL